MALVESDMLDFQNSSFRLTSCFPFSISRIRNRVAQHLLRRNKRRFIKTKKQHSQLTTNMDSYQYAPSDNEFQQLLYI